MRIVHVFLWSNATFSGGVPRAVLDRSMYLASKGHDVTIVTRGYANWHEPHEIDGVKVVPLRVRDLQLSRLAMHPIGLLWRIKQEVERMHAESPIDIVDSHDGPVRLALEGFFKRTRVPHVFTVHSDPKRRPDNMNRLVLKYYQWAEERSRTRADAIAAVSKFVADLDPRLASNSKVLVIYNPAPQDVLDRPQAIRGESEKLRILFPHRLDRGKAWRELLNALAKCESLDRLKVTVAGSGPDQAEFEQTRLALGLADTVDYVGQVADRKTMLDLLDSHDVYAIPSHFEAFSIGLLEAMARGMCCVSSDLGANVEALGEEAGCFFTLGDVDAFRDRIDELSNNPALVQDKQMAALERVQDFRQEECFEKLEALYRELVGQPT